MFEIFFGEDGCDRWIAENIELPERGFFVDCGCAHPERYSQTAFLRARGWRGLAIDGDPAYAPEWQNIHDTTFVNAVLSGGATRLPFLVEPTNSLVSRVHAEGPMVPARPLLSILTEYGVDNINFMAMDVEGMEAEVLTEFFNKAAVVPRILVVEYHSEHKGRDPEVFNVMLGANYQLRHLTNSNAVFTR